MLLVIGYFIADNQESYVNEIKVIDGTEIIGTIGPTDEFGTITFSYTPKNGGDHIITFEFAGSSYKGAVEDVSNLNGIPAVTCEVLSPFASVGIGSVKRSYTQMKSFLNYFGIL